MAIIPIVISLAAYSFCLIRQRQARRHTGMQNHTQKSGYSGGPEGAVYPLFNPEVPDDIEGEKEGELPPGYTANESNAVVGDAPSQAVYDDAHSDDVVSGGKVALVAHVKQI